MCCLTSDATLGGMGIVNLKIYKIKSDTIEINCTVQNGLIDHHTHIFSQEVSNYLINNIDGLSSLPDLGPEEFMKVIEQDHVEQATVLSNAYFFTDNFNALQSENDRVAEVVRQHPEKLVGFFSINPLTDSAFSEMDRNAGKEQFAGLKLHLANSEVDFQNPAHVKRLGDIFKKANELNLGIVIHMRTQAQPYGQEETRIFVDNVLSKALEIPIVIAHMAGWGGYDSATDDALSVFSDLASNDDLRDGIYFDLSAVIRPVRSSRQENKDKTPEWYPEERYHRLVKQIKTVGIDRILFGTDWPEWTPQNYASDIIENLPLTCDEHQKIFSNRAPWFN